MERLSRPRGELAAPLASAASYIDYPIAQTDQIGQLRWVWSVIARNKILLLAAVAASVVPTICYLAWAKPVYRSTVTIQVNPETAHVLPYRDVSDSAVGISPNFDLYMKTQDVLIRSNLLRHRVAERLKAGTAGAEVINGEQLRSEPEISRVEGSQILKLSYFSEDPERAAEAANVWANEFIKLHLELRSRTSRKATEFLQEQLKNLKEKVQKSEQALIQYSRDHQNLNIEQKQDSVVRQKFGYLNSEVARAEKDFIAKKAENDNLKRITLDNYPESLKDPVIVGLEAKVFSSEQELGKLLSQFGERWPAVVQKQQEVALAKSQLNQAKRNALNRALVQAELKNNAARSEYDMLAKALSSQASLVGQLNEASVEFNSLRREFETGEQLYQGLLQRLKETGVGAGLEFGNIQIADLAKPENEPHSPRRAVSLGLALIFGITLGIALSFGREYSDRTIKDPWTIEQLGLPLLGWTPRVHSKSFAHEHDFRAHLLPAPGEAGQKEIALSVSQSQARESFRVACVSLLLSKSGSPPKSIVVTSAIPGEGKTTTCISLAVELAGMGRRILLVDADFRRHSLSKTFGFDQVTGLSTFLAGGKLRVEATSVPNLFVLPAGTAPPNPAGLLNSTRLEEALRTLETSHHMVLVDAPPVLSVADAGVLAAKCGGVVFVVDAEATPDELLRQALARISRTGCTILGGVVNKVDINQTAYRNYTKYYYDEKYTSGVAATE